MQGWTTLTKENKLKKIHEFRVLHDGWETDNAAWVSQDALGKRKLETTNHGQKCEMGKKTLFEKIAETETSLNALKKAAELMRSNVEVRG